MRDRYKLINLRIKIMRQSYLCVFRMPIQAPQWTEFLSCPVCCHDFDVALRGPVSLGCGHTICQTCLANLHRKQCPFDQVHFFSWKLKIFYFTSNVNC